MEEEVSNSPQPYTGCPGWAGLILKFFAGEAGVSGRADIVPMPNLCRLYCREKMPPPSLCCESRARYNVQSPSGTMPSNATVRLLLSPGALLAVEARCAHTCADHAGKTPNLALQLSGYAFMV